MRLYYAPGSCAVSPHIVAREAGLDIELSRVTFNGAERTTEHGEDFFKVNTRGGYVPALRLDDGEVMTEGAAIIQYLADQAPAKALMPEKGTMPYYRMLEWITFISTELHKGFGVFFRQDAPEGEKAFALEKLLKRIAVVETELADKEYLNGAFSIADAYLYTIMRWTARTSIVLAETHPNVTAFMQRMETRDGVKAAISEEGLEAFVK